jgi:hypothetical protein
MLAAVLLSALKIKNVDNRLFAIILYNAYGKCKNMAKKLKRNREQ